MNADMFRTLFAKMTRTGTDRNSSARNRRPNRRCAIGLGLEGLEGRLPLSGAIGTIGVTVTNQGDGTTQGGNTGTTTSDPNGSLTIVPTTSQNGLS